MTNIIFLGGIHGSGKNFILQHANFQNNITHLTASEVLKWKDFSENPNDKKVSSISNTQNLLISNLKKIITNDGFYILDGHFVLLNKDGQIERIPETTFSEINPKALIIKTASPNSILERLKQRDNCTWSTSLISDMQKEEIQYAKEISLKLNIKLYHIEDNQESLLSQIINSEFNNG